EPAARQLNWKVPCVQVETPADELGEWIRVGFLDDDDPILVLGRGDRERHGHLSELERPRARHAGLRVRKDAGADVNPREKPRFELGGTQISGPVHDPREAPAFDCPEMKVLIVRDDVVPEFLEDLREERQLLFPVVVGTREVVDRAEIDLSGHRPMSPAPARAPASRAAAASSRAVASTARCPRRLHPRARRTARRWPSRPSRTVWGSASGPSCSRSSGDPPRRETAAPD